MPTIRIEYEVPEDDCEKCNMSYIFNKYVGRVCTAFTNYVNLDIGVNGKYQRCQACIDAEVKAQPE